MDNITKLQDADCRWYWIPNELVEEFKEDDDFLCGKDYLSEAKRFDEFGEKYGDYTTGGDPDIMPEFFKSKTGLDWINNLGEGTLKSMSSFNTLQKIVEQLEKCDYGNEAGVLRNNTAFLSLKRIAEGEKSTYLPLKLVPDGTKYTPKQLLEIFNTRGLLLADTETPVIEWTMTKDKLPDGEKSVACLVVKIDEWTNREGKVFYNKTTQILEYNPHHKCWDNEDGDDYNCDIEKVEKWITLSDLETLNTK